MPHAAFRLALAAIFPIVTSCASAGPQPVQSTPASSAADLSAMLATTPSELAEAIAQFEADRGSLGRTYRVGTSPERRARLVTLCDDWLQQLDAVNPAGLSLPGSIDYTLLVNHVRHEKRQLEHEQRRYEAIQSHLPFAATILEIEEARRRGDQPQYEHVAGTLDAIRKSAEDAKKAFEAGLKKPEGSAEDAPPISPTQARQVMQTIESLQRDLSEWHGFYNAYDPQFTWWTRKPYDAAAAALREYAKLAREKGVGITSDNPDVIVGTPIGREALIEELSFAMIPYTPEELLAIAEREAAWCHAELKRAANELGLADDWKAALDRVKDAHGEPGEQPALIRDLAEEAVIFLRERDLVTVPPLAEETWRMDMMSQERQLVTPFFTGGEVISVAFPTEGMDHQQKVMSLRSNNIHFARATVHHELIPGHHLQQFMESRWRTYREPFGTPFWTEGWALYWEMRLWDENFARGPEDRIGMLFWRLHRCARIVFSLKFQVQEWTAQQCVDYLVDAVGHEKASAEGEVRRSISGDYGPLYQAAYMLGGLQIRALHAELVASGKLTDRQFHDAVLRENNMPIEMVRAALTGQRPPKDFHTSWRFDDAKGR